MNDFSLPVTQPLARTGDDSFRSIIEALPDGVCVIDREWRFTFMNRRAYELVGSTDVVGHTIWERFPGNLEEPFNTAYRTTMSERIPQQFEAFHASLSLWLRVQSEPYGDGIVVFFADVSAARLANERAAEASRQLAQAMDATSDAIFSLDRSWRFSLLNANAVRLIDPLERGLLGLNLWEEFPAAAGAGDFWDNYHATMNEGQSRTFEAYYPAPIDRWFTIQSEPSPEGIVVFFRDITERRRREQTVATQQDLLTKVQQTARVATWELDIARGTIQYGPGSFDLFGYTAGAVNRLEGMQQILLPGHFETLQATMAEALRTGAPVLVEFAAKTPDGTTVWIESRGEAVAGSRSRLRGMSIDISKRKLDEQELLASAERYRVLADLNPQALWAGDAAGNIIYANQGFLAYIGLTMADLDGAGWLQGFAPSDRQRIVDVWTHCVTTGEDYDVEAMIRHAPSGKHRYWNLRAAPVRDSSGAIVQWLGIGNDIHEAKTAAAALRAEQTETERKRAELQTIYTTSPVGLALFDPVDYRILNLNDREAEMLGKPRAELMGRTLEEIAPAATMPTVRTLFESVARGQTIRDQLVEGELPGRPGERRAWTVNYSPVFNENGTVRAISSATIEITNQKRAEAALVQSEKLAAVGRLASSISHEINNPLEAITNLLYLIAHDPKLPDDMKVYVHMAQSELQRVSQIATQTLRFHRQAVNPTSVTPKDLMGAVLQLYTGRLANSNIKVDARYNTSTHILCFENDIRQVLNNLIANAIDAMRTGGRLIVRAHESHQFRGDTPIQGVRLTIADTGHGMTQEVLARVFEPFYTTKDLNGTGLGLWISAGIVERHQGHLRVRSSVDPARHGTVFTLFLPCKEVTTL